MISDTDRVGAPGTIGDAAGTPSSFGVGFGCSVAARYRVCAGLYSGTKRNVDRAKMNTLQAKPKWSAVRRKLWPTAVDSPLKLAGSTPCLSTSFKIGLALPSCVTCAS
jgi:hypothetical protein